jgi:hypothetical protein
MLLVAVVVIVVAALRCRLHGVFGSRHNTSAATAISNEVTADSMRAYQEAKYPNC